jgi:hypothetical protein
MRPKSMDSDLPSSHDLKVHLHNEFVKHMKELKEEIKVSFFFSTKCKELLLHILRWLLEKYPSPKTDGQQIQQRWGSRGRQHTGYRWKMRNGR